MYILLHSKISKIKGVLYRCLAFCKKITQFTFFLLIVALLNVVCSDVAMAKHSATTVPLALSISILDPSQPASFTIDGNHQVISSNNVKINSISGGSVNFNFDSAGSYKITRYKMACRKVQVVQDILYDENPIEMSRQGSKNVLYGIVFSIPANFNISVCKNLSSSIYAYKNGANSCNHDDGLCPYQGGVKLNLTVEDFDGVTITKTQDLEFGIVHATQQDVTVNTSGNYVGNPQTTSVSGKNASFDINGTVGRSFQVTQLPSEVTLTNGEDTMSVTDFTSNIAVNTNATVPAELNLGATLHVKNGQKAGEYSGPFTVTISY